MPSSGLMEVILAASRAHRLDRHALLTATLKGRVVSPSETSCSEIIRPEMERGIRDNHNIFSHRSIKEGSHELTRVQHLYRVQKTLLFPSTMKNPRYDSNWVQMSRSR